MSDSITNAEIGKTVFEEIYSLAMSGMAAATASVEGKAKILINGVAGSIALTKDLGFSSSNPYEKIGIVTGNLIDIIVLNKFKSARAAFGMSEITAHFSSKDILIPLYTDYVSVADDFYSRILTEDGFFKETLEGLKNNAWDNIKYMFSNSINDITPDSLVSGIKSIFDFDESVPSGKTISVDNENGKINFECFSLDEDESKQIIQEVTKHDQIKQLSLNSQTYNIVKEDNLIVRNAIEHIPTVSFLLSNILIRTNEILDIGEHGLYKVKSGDTMSEIAQSFGFTTQQLLKYNTWLIDEGRVSFNQDKVLIETDATILNVKNHTLIGTTAEDRLIDRNGGDDILIGNGGGDYIEGGKGFDTYYTNSGDVVNDSDGKGRVYFENSVLTGGVLNEDSGVYEGSGGIYTLNGSTLTFTKDDKTLTIKNYSISQSSLGINVKKAA
ncbi:MAG: LysM domain-containing protein [Aliarcobacter butzleri]|nr:LysM domain-containing protein [Aliarcobacter butzleri]